MTTVQTLEMLCALVAQQAEVIRHLATELERARSLTGAECQMIASAKSEYLSVIGDD